MRKNEMVGLLERAIKNAESTGALVGNPSKQAQACGLRALGRAEAYRAIARALRGDAVSLRIDAE